MTGDRYLSKEDFYSLFSGVVKISFFYTTPRLTNLGLDLGQTSVCKSAPSSRNTTDTLQKNWKSVNSGKIYDLNKLIITRLKKK